VIEKINSEIIKSENDILDMLDNLVEKRDNEWWSNFYSDKEKAIPFFKNVPDENLVSYFDLELLKQGRALDSGCFHHIKPHRRNQYLNAVLKLLKPDGYFSMNCFNLNGGANISDYDVYRDYSMHGGLGFSEYKLKTILETYFNILEFREMKEIENDNIFRKSFMWTTLLKKK